MAVKHEMEIEISPAGKVEVVVKGAKGKKCMEYVQIFNSMGKVTDKKNTGEYYEPEETVSLIDSIRSRFTK